MSEFGHFQILINDEWVEGSDSQQGQIISPATGELLATVAIGTPQDVDTAVAAARAQMDGGSWSSTTGAERGKILNRLASLVERDADLLSRLDALCIGRPVAEAMGFDVDNAARTFRYYSGLADKIEGRVIPNSGYFGRSMLSYTTRHPVGVVAAIVPWNAPLMITAWKLGAALAAGCAVVLKPSEESPLSQLHLAKLAREAGLPAGVLNVITGPGDVCGAALVTHPDVDKVSFTGSPEVGRWIQRAAADTFKRVSLELGGKSPQVIFEDADLESVVMGCAAGLFLNQGQVCAAGSRVLVHRSIADEVTQRLIAVADAIRLGDPGSPETQMGSLASQKQLERVQGFIGKGLAEGARIASGGALGVPDRGYYLRPTIFTQVSPTMAIAQEEIFGPVGCVIPFDSDDEAVAIANHTRYGLAASVWTQDIGRAHRVARAIRAGSVGINAWTPNSPELPWGGFKTSGIGRELGLSGVLAYTEEQVVNVVL
ncbi:MAG: aldehyde dehydrogenase [Pigmentiphaga sp.]